MERQELEFSDGKSNKFWHIELSGSQHTVNYRRIGTAGQTQTKDFGSPEAARKSYEKLVAEKLKEGYNDADGATTPAEPKEDQKAPVATSSSPLR